jgi:hypothetical protein
MPEAVQIPPLAPTQVQEAPIRPGGSMSFTMAPATLLGPALDAVIV